MSNRFLTFLCVLIAAAIFKGTDSQFNYRCRTTPTRWFGHSFLIDYDTKYARFSYVYYNAILESVYERVYSRGNDGRTEYEEWLDFRTQTKYNRTFGDECRSYTFSRPFSPFGVPSDAEFEGRGTLGVDETGLKTELLVDFFAGDIDGGRYHMLWAPVSTTEGICVPVMESYVRQSTTTPYLDRRNIHIVYTNLTTSFENPPEHCEPVSFNGKPLKY